MSETPQTEPAARVLIVDDDLELCGLMEEYLRQQGLVVSAVQMDQPGSAKPSAANSMSSRLT